MVVIPVSLGGLLDRGGMNVPSARKVRRPSRKRCCMQSICIRGQKQMSPRLIPSWLWRVSRGIEPSSFSIRRMRSKLRATI